MSICCSISERLHATMRNKRLRMDHVAMFISVTAVVCYILTCSTMQADDINIQRSIRTEASRLKNDFADRDALLTDINFEDVVYFEQQSGKGKINHTFAETTPFSYKKSQVPRLVTQWRHDILKRTRRFDDLLSVRPPTFLENFRNPCFYQDTKLRCLPHFFMIGFLKCGTTDLYNKLAIHPDLVPPKIKEPEWWHRVRFWGHGWNHYIDNFGDATKVISQVATESHIHPLVTYEASANTIVDNTYWMALHQNKDLDEPAFLNAHFIQHFLPNARFVVITRNPTDRLYSSYNYGSRQRQADFQASPMDFHKRVVHAIKWLRACFETLSMRQCLFFPPHEYLATLPILYPYCAHFNSVVHLRSGLYSEYLTEWNKVFPENQTLVLRLEDYKLDSLSVLNKVYQHVGVSALGEEYRAKLEKMETANVLPDKVAAMKEETRAILDEFYEPYNAKFSKMIDQML